MDIYKLPISVTDSPGLKYRSVANPQDSSADPNFQKIITSLPPPNVNQVILPINTNLHNIQQPVIQQSTADGNLLTRVSKQQQQSKIGNSIVCTQQRTQNSNLSDRIQQQTHVASKQQQQPSQQQYLSLDWLLDSLTPIFIQQPDSFSPPFENCFFLSTLSTYHNKWKQHW